MLLEYERKMRLDTDKLLRGDRDYVSTSGKTNGVLSPVQRVKPMRLFDKERKE